MRNLRLPLLLLFTLLSACGDDDDGATGDGGTTALKPLASEAELLNVLRGALEASSASPQLDLLQAESTTTTAADGATSSSSSTSTGSSSGGSDSSGRSETNLQIAGVDEADRMKSDGQRLYRIKPQPAYAIAYAKDEVDSSAAAEPAVTALPEPTTTSLCIDCGQSQSNAIDIYQLDAATPAATLLASVETGAADDPQLSGLYLLDNDRLVLIYGQRGGYWGVWGDPWSWQGGRSVVEILDMSDPANPIRERRVEVDGHLIASRRIDDRLYLATRFTPQPTDYTPYPFSIAEREENVTALAESSAENLLPAISVDGSSSPLVDHTTTYQPTAGTAASPDLVTLLQLDLGSGAEQWQSVSLVGGSETLFMTHRAAYIAAATAEYSQDDRGYPLYSADWQTTLHKFALTESGPVYRGSGEVSGHLGWEVDKKPFRMGEVGSDGGLLAVVTSEGEQWLGDSSTRLTLLQDEGDGTLQALTTLADLGETNERLYASRFVGDRAYLVTFLVTDPLYIIDLSDPANLSRETHVTALKIDGYSDYLHPFDDGYLLGLGKDAVADSSGDNGRGAWYQGVKLSLFDVRDAANPQEIDSLVIGKRGTESNALRDHHAFTWLSGDASSGRPHRLALPIALHETPSSYLSSEANGPSSWYDWTQTALYSFEISSSGISQRGELVAEQRDSGVAYDYPDHDISDDRALLLDDALFYSHGSGLLTSRWGE